MRAIVLNGRIVKMRTVFVVIEIWERNRPQLRRLDLLGAIVDFLRPPSNTVSDAVGPKDQ